MNQIQKSFRITKKGSSDVSIIRKALRDYSIKYFFPEIMDEMHGYVDHAILQKIFEAIGATRRRDFKVADLIPHIGGNREVIEVLPTALHALFECSAIGNIIKIKERHHYLAFRYRNRHAAFRPDEMIVIHRGLWRAFNLPLDQIGEGIEEYAHPEPPEAGGP